MNMKILLFMILINSYSTPNNNNGIDYFELEAINKIIQLSSLENITQIPPLN